MTLVFTYIFIFLIIALYSNTRFLTDETFHQRVTALDVDLSLELSLMGGLISVTGTTYIPKVNTFKLLGWVN